MKFSIITATFNSAKTLQSAIESLRSQAHKEVEYIVIDGGSSDKTVEIIRQNSDIITKWKSEKDNGIYDALNNGIKAAEGNIIGILHSDDIYAYSEVLQDIENVFTTTNVDAVYSDLDYVSFENTDRVKRKWRSGSYNENSFIFGWMPPHPTFFVKKEIYEKYGLYNIDFKTAADYELMLRFIYKHKIKLGYLPKVTVKMRMGGLSNSSIKHRLFANREDKKAWIINGLKPKFFTIYFKPLRKIFQYL